MRKRRRRKVKQRYIIALVVIAVLGSIFLWQAGYVFKGPGESPRVFIIEKGRGVVEIATDLKSEGLIKSKSLFAALAFVGGKHANLMAGAYELSPAMNTVEVLNKIASGDIINEELTVIEGWDLRDIGWALENKGMFQAEEVFEFTGFPVIDYSKPNPLSPLRDFSDAELKFEFLQGKPKSIGLEGYLFPDTYQLARGESVSEVIEKMLSNFSKKITPELEEEIAKQGRTLFEVLTMASLLEKEVKTYGDRQVAAGLLWKRLRAGWPLQVDATLTYLTGKPSHELTKDDLSIDSLYNTYKYKGLPLGPICNPGLASIDAAVYYKDSPYWYYLTTPEGETIFSRTLQEHAVNKYKYLR